MRLRLPDTRRRILALVFASAVTASPLLGATAAERVPGNHSCRLWAAERRRPSPSLPTDAFSCACKPASCG